mgnify:CR=1 FL=1
MRLVSAVIFAATVALASGAFAQDESGVRPHMVHVEGNALQGVRGFDISATEITFNHWDECVRAGGCQSNRRPDDKGMGRGARPVIHVSWYDAQEYGAGDVDDVLAAAAHFAAKPYVDAARLGIVGRSRGGMVTLLAIEKQPKRFKAAVDVVGLTDFLAYMAYKPEYRRQEVAREPNFKGMPFDNLKAYMDASPILHVEKIEAPLLVHATTYDRTVPPELHSERLVEALKAHGKTYEYKLYDHAPGGHGFSEGDSPEAADSLERIVAFLGKHLK